MISNDVDGLAESEAPAAPEQVGLALSRWQRFRTIVKVVELRLRFVALMAATALVFAYWDELWNRYEKWTRPVALEQMVASAVEHYCPMHPHVVQEEPGSCPICGMPLTKRAKGEKVSLPSDITARIELAPSRVAQAGIKTVSISYEPLVFSVRTVGSVAFDERRMARIVSKVPGKSRVEQLHVNFSGQEVEVGQTVAELYSPELNQAVTELLSARARADQPGGARSAVARSLVADLHEMVLASAEKLKRWGITQAQVDEILKKKSKTDFTIPILSPVRGHVYRKNVVEGQEVREGEVLFEVVDLDVVWVQAQVYEQQLALVREGQAVEASVDAFPGESFAGTVEFLQPHLDPATRTVEVRYSLENHNHRLRPGMFASVTIKTPVADTPAFQEQAVVLATNEDEGHHAGHGDASQKNCPVTNLKLGSMGDPISVKLADRKIWVCCTACPPKLLSQPAKYLARLATRPRGNVLSVPERAVIDTGSRKVVYVEREPGVFEGREVVLGPRVGDRFPVLDGLAPGENVAAAGAFLIDAESRLNPEPEPMNAPVAPLSPHQHRKKL